MPHRWCGSRSPKVKPAVKILRSTSTDMPPFGMLELAEKPARDPPPVLIAISHPVVLRINESQYCVAVLDPRVVIRHNPASWIPCRRPNGQGLGSPAPSYRFDSSRRGPSSLLKVLFKVLFELQIRPRSLDTRRGREMVPRFRFRGRLPSRAIRSGHHRNEAERWWVAACHYRGSRE